MNGSRSAMRSSRWRVIVLAALLLGASPGRAQDAQPVQRDAERAAIIGRIESVGRRGFLYEVARPASSGRIGKRLFLYGTIHVGRAGSEPFNAPLLGALRESRRLALEADPTDTAAVQRIALALGQYGPDDSLERHVSPALLARVRAFGERNGLPPERVARFRPWLLANMVVVQQLNGSGLDSDLGSELYLAGFAQGVRLSIVEVEGMEAQLRLLAGVPEPLQVAQLDEALDEVDHPASSADGPSDALALFDLWLDGDAAAGDALVAQMHRGAQDKVYERYFVETLIDQRNRSMADKAESYLERPGNTFFAVGALHLFGERGLLREFERRGYRVVDLQPPKTSRGDKP